MHGSNPLFGRRVNMASHVGAAIWYNRSLSALDAIAHRLSIYRQWQARTPRDNVLHVAVSPKATHGRAPHTGCASVAALQDRVSGAAAFSFSIGASS